MMETPNVLFPEEKEMSLSSNQNLYDMTNPEFIDRSVTFAKKMLDLFNDEIKMTNTFSSDVLKTEIINRMQKIPASSIEEITEIFPGYRNEINGTNIGIMFTRMIEMVNVANANHDLDPDIIEPIRTILDKIEIKRNNNQDNEDSDDNMVLDLTVKERNRLRDNDDCESAKRKDTLAGDINIPNLKELLLSHIKNIKGRPDMVSDEKLSDMCDHMVEFININS